jgi:MFS family permease
MTGPPSSAPTAPPSRVTVVGIGAAAALVPLNSTMVAVALPRIASGFDITASRASVLVTVYLAAMLVGQPLAGRLVDRVGARTSVTAALVGFSLCSLAAPLAPAFAWLVGARLGQAVFAAVLAPGVQAMLRAVTPPDHRGRTFGLLGSVIGVGAAAGPLVGGALTQVWGWPAVFVANVPVAAAAFVAVLLTPAARGLVRPVASAGESGSLRNPVFVAAYGVQALSTVPQYALLLLTPIILDARGWSTGSIGLVLGTLTIGMVLFGPIGGRAGDRRGRRAPVLAGLGVAVVATAVTALGGAGIGPVVLALALVVFGVGLGYATPGVMTAGLESVPESRTGAAGGILSTARYLGSISASLAIAGLVTADAGGTGVVLAGATVAVGGAWFLALRLPGPTDGQGRTRILAWASGSARAAKAAGVPSRST